jgi:hypothetical protein
MGKRIWTAIFCTMLVSACWSAETGPKRLMLFGVPLKGETRAELRKVFKTHGMVATREDDSYWSDQYDPGSVLDGASHFGAFYVSATGRFAMAEYTFQSSMDTQLVGKIIDMIRSKYGPPTYMKGTIAVGEVLAAWEFPDGTVISVSRDWPDTTAYLDYIDRKARDAMESEIAVKKRRQAQQSDSRQNSAY